MADLGLTGFFQQYRQHKSCLKLQPRDGLPTCIQGSKQCPHAFSSDELWRAQHWGQAKPRQETNLPKESAPRLLSASRSLSRALLTSQRHLSDNQLNRLYHLRNITVYTESERWRWRSFELQSPCRGPFTAGHRASRCLVSVPSPLKTPW